MTSRRLAVVLALAFLAGCSGTPPTNTTDTPDVIRESKITGRVELAGETNHGDVEVVLSGPAGGTSRSDAAGAFAFDALPAGTYTVIATASSTLESVRIGGITVADRASAALPTLNFTSVGTLTGTATLGAATGNAGIVVSAIGSGVVAVTDDAGSYTLKNVPVGARTVVVSAAGRGAATANVTVARGTITTVAPLTLVPTIAQGHLTGSVTLTGETSHANLVVTLSGKQTAVTLTSATGAFDFPNLSDGSYTVTAHAESTRELSKTVSATVSNGDGTAPSITFSPLGSISGKITRDGAATGNAATVVFVAGKSSATFTNDTGDFTLTGVDTGSQTITASHAGFDLGTGAPVTVAWKGTATAATLDLVPTVTSSNNASVASSVAKLGLAASAGTDVNLGSGVGVTTTNASGQYVLSNLPTGLFPLKLSVDDYEANFPQLLVVPGGRAFVADGTVYELPHVIMPKGKQLFRAAELSAMPRPTISGDALVLSATTGARKVDATTGAVTQLTTTRSNRVEVAKDGTHALVWSGTGGAQTLTVHNLNTGAQTTLSTNAAQSGLFFTTAAGKAVAPDNDNTLKVTTLPNSGTSIVGPGWFQSNNYFGCSCSTTGLRVSANQATVLFPVVPSDFSCAVRLKALNVNTQSVSDIVSTPDAIGSSVSEDGTRVAYGRGTNCSALALWTATSTGSAPLQLATDFGGTVVLSPDGTKAAYLSNTNVLKVVYTNGTTTPVAVANVLREEFGWTADSSRLVAVITNGSGSFAPKELRSVDVNSGVTVLLGSNLNAGGFTGGSVAAPYFTSVGSKVITTLNSGSPVLLIADAITGVANTFGPNVSTVYTLSPDKTKIAFVTENNQPGAALKVVALSSSLATVIDTNIFTGAFSTAELFFTFSPDGARIAYQTQALINGSSFRYLKSAPVAGGTSTFINASPLLSTWMGNTKLASTRLEATAGPTSVLDGVYATTVP